MDIEVPIIFTMKTNQIGKLRYYGQIGFGMGFLLNAKADNTFTPDDGSEQISEEGTHSDLFKTTRQSLILGAGIEIPLSGSTYIRTGIKYDNAFINVMKGNNTADLTVANDARNNFMELNLSIIF
jgi:opacity protein-like surface antigen